MKHISVISREPARAQLGTTEILTIVATALSAIATVIAAVVPLLGQKK